MNQKHSSISSYSDLSKLSHSVKFIHFRKFVSKKIIKKILSECPNLVEISFSSYAYKRCNDEILKCIYGEGVNLSVSSRKAGRPNMIEKIHVDSILRNSIYLTKELNILNVEGRI